jgi:S-adenosylmethionine synthetase
LFVYYIFENAARLVVGVVQDIFQPADAFVMQRAVFKVDVVKLQKEKPGSGFDVKSMAIVGREQEHVARLIFKLALVNALVASTLNNVNQLKKIVFMLQLGVHIQGLMLDAEGFVQILFDHIERCFACGLTHPDIAALVTPLCASRKEGIG